MPRFHLEELAKYEESAEYQGLKIANSSIIKQGAQQTKSIRKSDSLASYTSMSSDNLNGQRRTRVVETEVLVENSVVISRARCIRSSVASCEILNVRTQCLL